MVERHWVVFNTPMKNPGSSPALVKATAVYACAGALGTIQRWRAVLGRMSGRLRHSGTPPCARWLPGWPRTQSISYVVGRRTGLQCVTETFSRL